MTNTNRDGGQTNLPKISDLPDYFYKTLVENIALGITVINKDFEIVFSNASQGEFFGKSVGSLIGRNCFLEFEKRDRVCDHCPGVEVLKTGKAKIADTHGVRDDGSRFDVRLHAFPVFDDKGEVDGFIEVVEDITERKKLEAELLKVQKIESIGVLAGGIAHDFNNILAGILSHASLAKNSSNDSSQVRDLMDGIMQAVGDAGGLTQQLRTLSRGGKPIREPIAVSPLVKESAKFALSGSGCDVHFNFADDLPDVEVDRGQVVQVISNLVINADQAMPDGGTVEISAEKFVVDGESKMPLQPGKYVKITVADHGIGISADHIASVFDPYFTTKQRGSGLGLTISLSVMQKHGGHISVESRQGWGTTFTVFLPALEGVSLERRTFSKAGVIKGHGRVLFMDDDPILRRIMTKMLDHLGYDFSLSSSGEEALQIYETATIEGRPFDVVILDLTVPGGMGGQEAIAKLQEMDPNVTALVSSGYSESPVLADYHKFGFKDRLSKPYTLEELGSILNRTLR